MLYRSYAKALADEYHERKEKTKEVLNVISDYIENSASRGFYSIAYLVNPLTLTDSEVNFLVEELKSYIYDVEVFTDNFSCELLIKWN